jgi:hypothetical protein
MKREGTIGAATFLAIAAVVGVSLQTGPKQEGARPDQARVLKHAKSSIAKKITHPVGSACKDLAEQLEDFLDVEELAAPGPCYKPLEAPGEELRKAVAQRASQLKFVIATLPDPVHTHLPVLFDQFAVAIQEGAQDEKYDFDSSWFPWDDEETQYALLDDQKNSDQEKELKEEQPGIILFRKAIDCHGDKAKDPDCTENLSVEADKAQVLSNSYREGLVVFVVGEEATHGIHRDQFRNALAWIEALQPTADTKVDRMAILGPTFSGSFPSVVQVLSEQAIRDHLGLPPAQDSQPLAIYSGSVSGNDAAKAFRNKLQSQVTFHSFVQNDDEILQRFCNYITQEQHEFDVGRVAIISEDETAYGSKGVDEPRSKRSGASKRDRSEVEKKDCFSKALKLYYPRDISALRGAYQNKSLFDGGTSPQPAETQRKNLPTDLADPSGKVHDSIRSYGGNQTPLTQEAFMLEIVAALRALNARYIFLRSSNSLDQLFLTNFLRRGYPDGRIVIFGSDLMFIRERGTTGLSGTMTLSTYPLFPLERDWTEHQALPAADRVFSADGTEGTYVAFRLLLNDKRLNQGTQHDDQCHVFDPDPDHIFLPSIACSRDPIPDYSPPFWTLPKQCGEMADGNPEKIANKGDACSYPGPATWLSVIGANRFWPMASLTSATPNAPLPDKTTTGRMKDREGEPGGRPEMPVEMKVFLLVLLGFSVFHAWCCWSGSYTAKPAFRAHFASTGDWRHTFLVFSGSCCVAFLAIVTGWGCGVFSIPAPGLDYPWFTLGCVVFVCLMAWLAILANNRTAWKLAQDISSCPGRPRMTKKDFTTWNYRASGLLIAAIVLFCVFCILPVELMLLPENRVLTYWRAMHLASGVSPIVPILLVFGGLYLSFWFTLHGLALFGPDRPCLPSKECLALEDGKGNRRDFLRMFSQEDAAASIEQAAMPLNGRIFQLGASLFLLFLAIACGIGRGVPVRSLGAESYSIIFLLCLDICCTLAIVEAWRLCRAWDELKRLLAFLDRLPLRRTLAALRGFSWGGVWKMSGNVLEVRYKVMSRQMECMNHTLASLQESLKTSFDPGAQVALTALTDMRDAGIAFADWYSTNYKERLAGDLSSFSKFQQSISYASGTLLAKLLVPAWRLEEASLVVEIPKVGKEETAPSPPPLTDKKHIQNAEEFVCLNYLGFIQNVLGRLRTMALNIMLLFLVATVATSTYPFDPQRALSAVLIILFVIVGVVIVKVYADMHRDSTLSHVTNTKPGELGTEFWFKIVGFGFAPMIGLLTRIFPGITDFVFSWLQPGISSLK